MIILLLLVVNIFYDYYYYYYYYYYYHCCGLQGLHAGVADRLDGLREVDGQGRPLLDAMYILFLQHICRYAYFFFFSF